MNHDPLVSSGYRRENGSLGWIVGKDPPTVRKGEFTPTLGHNGGSILADDHEPPGVGPQFNHVVPFLVARRTEEFNLPSRYAFASVSLDLCTGRSELTLHTVNAGLGVFVKLKSSIVAYDASCHEVLFT